METQQLLVYAHELLQQCQQVQRDIEGKPNIPAENEEKKALLKKKANLIGQLEAFHGRVDALVAKTLEGYLEQLSTLRTSHPSMQHYLQEALLPLVDLRADTVLRELENDDRTREDMGRLPGFGKALGSEGQDSRYDPEKLAKTIAATWPKEPEQAIPRPGCGTEEE